MQTLFFSVDAVVEALPEAAPAAMPALEKIVAFGVNNLPQILAAATMPALTFLQFVGSQEMVQPGALLDCISCLTALKQLYLNHMQLEDSTLHLGALPQLVLLDLEDVTLQPGGTVLRGGTTLQTLALDCYCVMDEVTVAAVKALPFLRKVSFYLDDMFDLNTNIAIASGATAKHIVGARVPDGRHSLRQFDGCHVQPAVPRTCVAPNMQ